MGRTARVRREDVLAAARAGFLEGGYAGTTLAQIAARLGISPAAVLRHAPTKQALFDQAMGLPAERDLHPLVFLEKVDGAADPRAVLRRVGEVFIPFIQQRLREVVAMYLHGKSRGGPIPLPFDPNQRPTPPQRNLRSLADYLRRARRARRVRVDDPYAAAAAFLGSLHSFVFLSEIAGAFEEDVSMDRFLATVLDVWMRGVAGEAKPSTRTTKRRKTS
jgi:AcrR family transcriptional regulator